MVRLKGESIPFMAAPIRGGQPGDWDEQGETAERLASLSPSVREEDGQGAMMVENYSIHSFTIFTDPPKELRTV